MLSSVSHSMGKADPRSRPAVTLSAAAPSLSSAPVLGARRRPPQTPPFRDCCVWLTSSARQGLPELRSHCFPLCVPELAASPQVCSPKTSLPHLRRVCPRSSCWPLSLSCAETGSTGIRVSSKVSSVNSAAKTLHLGILWWCASASQGAGFRPVLPLMQQTHARPGYRHWSRSHALPAPSHLSEEPPPAAGGKGAGADPCVHSLRLAVGAEVTVSRVTGGPLGDTVTVNTASLLSTLTGRTQLLDIKLIPTSSSTVHETPSPLKMGPRQCSRE